MRCPVHHLLSSSQEETAYTISNGWRLVSHICSSGRSTDIPSGTDAIAGIRRLTPSDPANCQGEEHRARPAIMHIENVFWDWD